MNKPTRLDRSARTLVLWCTECPPFREVGVSPGRLHTLEADHLTRVHGLIDTAAQQTLAARRHADR